MGDQGTDNCRERALRLLEQRPHSVAQLRRKLRDRQFPTPAIATVIADFTRLGLLDDRRLAHDYCQLAKTSSSPVGRLRVLAKLHAYGIAPELAAAAVDQVWNEAGDEEEIARAAAAAQRKMRLLPASQDPRKIREKLYRFLAGKGFPASICRAAVDAARQDDGG